MQILTKKRRGFTLIELLVVIAIIGILASIVLVSLSGARTKAKVARVQANIAQVRAMAEMAYTGSIYPNAETTANTNFITAVHTGGTMPNCTGAPATTLTSLVSLDGDTRSQQGAPDCTTANWGIVIQKQTGVGANTTYRAFVLLPGGSLTVASPWWCVDSGGNSRQISSTGLPAAPAADAAAVCPTS